MDNRNLRTTMGNNARNAMKQFAPQVIWDTWENLLNQIVK